VSADRILFSTDYPYESAEEAATGFDNCPISEPDRVEIGRENTVKIFKMQNAAESKLIAAPRLTRAWEGVAGTAAPR
jgi:2,3-dihydroxybenzoate decarboxylase